MSKKKITHQPAPKHFAPSRGSCAYRMCDGEIIQYPDYEYAKVYADDIKPPKEFEVVTRKLKPHELETLKQRWHYKK